MYDYWGYVYYFDIIRTKRTGFHDLGNWTKLTSLSQANSYGLNLSLIWRMTFLGEHVSTSKKRQWPLSTTPAFMTKPLKILGWYDYLRASSLLTQSNQYTTDSGFKDTLIVTYHVMVFWISQNSFIYVSDRNWVIIFDRPLPVICNSLKGTKKYPWFAGYNP